jgi:membrane protein YqaA with SNARE-associated domain
VGIEGTRDLLPVHGRLRRHPVTVRIGGPAADLAAARSAVARLTAAPHRHRRHRGSAASAAVRRAGAAVREALRTAARPPSTDSRARLRVSGLAASGAGLALVVAWSVAEAVSWPLLPEFALAVLAVAAPRHGPRLAVAAALGSLLGGALMYMMAAHGASPPMPLTTPRMHAAAAAAVAADGAAAVQVQPMSGVPYKVFAYTAGRADAGLMPFVAHSVPARGLRILAVGLFASAFGAACHRWRRWYPAYLVWFVVVFTAGLTAVVRSWS